MNVTIIGVGSLGTALVKAIIARGVVAEQSLTLYNRSMTEYLEQLKERGLDVRGPRKPEDPKHETDIIVCAVKPQEAVSALTPWKSCVNERTLVLSVMAGVRIATISQVLGEHTKVIRAMPNIGAYVGRSATAYYAPALIDPATVQIARSILEAFGETFELLEEGMLDAATAIAGSGPAYVCWLAEQMISSAIEFGFDREQALELVLQTVMGTAELLQQRRGEPAAIRAQVTSRGGTTAAALAVLEKNEAIATFEKAFQAAEARARELSEMMDQRPLGQK